MRYKSGTSIFLVISSLAITITLVISSCQLSDVPGGITGITATPLTPSPTPRICPPNIDIESLDGLEIETKFIVVLFDENLTHAESLEYLTGEKALDVMSFVGKILPKVLGPGDQYSIFSLGFRHYEAAKLNRYSSKITAAPEIVATPQSPMILTPIPTPTLSDAVLENQVAKNKYVSEVEAQNATATQSAFEYDCEKVAYDAMYKVTATAWSVTQQAEANEIATQIVVAQENRKEKIMAMETPFAADNVYEGLSHVTVDFESQCKEYERCILIIFDDLIDWRNVTPDYLQISLKGVDVVSILPQCEDLIQPSCQNVQYLWNPHFESYGAKSVTYFNGKRLEESLLNYFGGK